MFRLHVTGSRRCAVVSASVLQLATVAEEEEARIHPSDSSYSRATI